MKPFRSLKRELIIAIALLTASVCVVFSIGMSMAFDAAEDLLFDVHLDSDIDAFIRWYDKNPKIIETKHDAFDVFIVKDGDRSSLPAAIKALPEGEDDLFIDGREHDVRVETRGAIDFYFVFDEGDFEEFENFLFIAMLIIDGLVVGAAAWFARTIGNRIITPLQNLAKQVSALDDQGRGVINLESDASTRNEISILGEALQNYHRRTSEVLTREREFSADVSHELRTPLMSIHGAAELLDRQLANNDGSGDVLARIKRGCQQMSALTDALLFLAREPASFRDMMEPVSVEKVVNSQIAAVSDVTDNKGITVTLKQATDTTINAIPAVINIVIGNILKNAVKYTDQKTINVFVDDNSVVIQDYGPGIDDAVKDKLFDRFERGEARNEDGFGIGLALVRRFCDQYGWAIDFRSEKNIGTRVAVGFNA